MKVCSIKIQSHEIWSTFSAMNSAILICGNECKGTEQPFQNLGLIPNSIAHLLDDCVSFIEIHTL